MILIELQNKGNKKVDVELFDYSTKGGQPNYGIPKDVLVSVSIIDEDFNTKMNGQNYEALLMNTAILSHNFQIDSVTDSSRLNVFTYKGKSLGNEDDYLELSRDFNTHDFVDKFRPFVLCNTTKINISDIMPKEKFWFKLKMVKPSENPLDNPKIDRDYTKQSLNFDFFLSNDSHIVPMESTFISSVKYTDEKERVQTAIVMVVINYQQKKFDLYNSMGNKDFCFVNASHNSTQWLAVLEAAKNAIVFAKKEIQKITTNQ